MSQQFWTRSGQQVDGPFSAIHLRSLAHSGLLQPSHQVSTDGKKWILAQRVQGLDFPSSRSEPPIVGAVPSVEAAFETQASPGTEEIPFAELASEPVSSHDPPLPELAAQLPDLLPDEMFEVRPATPAKDVQADVLGMTAPLPAFDRSSLAIAGDAVEFSQRAAGALLGVLLSVLGLGLLGVVLAASGASGALAVVLVAIWLLGTVVGIVASMRGTCKQLRVERRADGSFVSTLMQRCVYLSVYKQETALCANSRLVKEMRRTASKREVDAAMIVITIVLLAMGGCPGIIFWLAWASQRNVADSGCYLRLFLEPQRGQQVLLYARLVPDYFGTRFGDPREVTRTMQLFSNVAGIQTAERLI